MVQSVTRDKQVVLAGELAQLGPGVAEGVRSVRGHLLAGVRECGHVLGRMQQDQAPSNVTD